MSIAQSLNNIVPFFMQKCPLCGRSNRMVVKGVYVKDGKHEVYPDIGYSFCNCRAVFYTNLENVTEPFSYIPVDGMITAPDVFFVEWGNNPYTFPYFNPRKYQLLWNMESLMDEMEDNGYKIEKAWRDFDLDSKTPMHFHIKLKKK